MTDKPEILNRHLLIFLVMNGSIKVLIKSVYALILRKCFFVPSISNYDTDIYQLNTHELP